MNLPAAISAITGMIAPCAWRCLTNGVAMPSELRAERRDGTLVLTISDPASRNTLSEQVFTAGIESLGVAESDPDVHCVVLRGDGEHFCAGGNLQRLRSSREAPREVQ